MLRFNLGLFPEQARRNAPWIMVLALIGIIYGALVALVQPNMKKLIAYSSVSHLGFVVLGIFSFTHGRTERRRCSSCWRTESPPADSSCWRASSTNAGTPTRSPSSAAWRHRCRCTPPSYLVIVLASVGLPLLNGFIGEFLVLSGAFQARADLRNSRRHRRDLERGLPAVDVPARLLRQSDARQ